MGCALRKEKSNKQVDQNVNINIKGNKPSRRNQNITGNYYLSSELGNNQPTNHPTSQVQNQEQVKQQGGKLNPHTIANYAKDLKESFENSLKKSEYSNKSAQQNVVKQHSKHSSSENQADYQNVQVGNNKQG